MFRCYGSRSAAAEKHHPKLYCLKRGQSVVKAMRNACRLTLFRLKYVQLKCNQRARGTRSFQKRWSAARRLDFPSNKLHFSSRYILRFSCKNRLTKPRVCGIILSASERASPRSNQIFRGIAQLVEQRSPKPRAEGSSPSAPAKPTPQKWLI